MSSVLMMNELSVEVVMMCVDERDENEWERDVIVMKDDVNEMNNTSVVVIHGNVCERGMRKNLISVHSKHSGGNLIKGRTGVGI